MAITTVHISSSFWSDDWVDSLTGLEKLLYMYLLTNMNVPQFEFYKITIKREELKDNFLEFSKEGYQDSLNVFTRKQKRNTTFERLIFCP